MASQQKKIENIYYDKYFKKDSIQDRVKVKLREIEKKFDELDDKLNLFIEIDKIGDKLIEDLTQARSEKWNDLSLEIALQDSGKNLT